MQRISIKFFRGKLFNAVPLLSYTLSALFEDNIAKYIFLFYFFFLKNFEVLKYLLN